MSSDLEREPVAGREVPSGIVVVHGNAEHGFSHRHEHVTRAASAKRLAGLKGFDFAGEYRRSMHASCPVYFVPNDTLVDAEAKELGIRSEHDLFGGIVPYSFVATKVITHPLFGADADAPTGWSRDFGDRVRGSVHRGFSAFTLADARRAGERLLEHGPVRIKPVRATGGRGQVVVRDGGALDAALATMDDAGELRRDGLVLEENLTGVTTLSVGQVCVADLLVSYYGTQRLTPDNAGAAVYGGSDLVVVRGGFDALLARDVPPAARLGVTQAREYDKAARDCYPGLIASRCNYDVAQGLTAKGERRSGVLEQSWRIGGASTAEIAALEAFRNRPALATVRTSSVEVYGDSEPPPNAKVYFRGVDERDGPLTKYARVEGLGDD